VLLFVGYWAYGNVANPLLVALLWWPKGLGHHCQCCCLLASYCLSSLKLTSWPRPKPTHFPTSENSSSSAKETECRSLWLCEIAGEGEGFQQAEANMALVHCSYFRSTDHSHMCSCSLVHHLWFYILPCFC
jgi:hypothetical protein